MLEFPVASFRSRGAKVFQLSNLGRVEPPMPTSKTLQLLQVAFEIPLHFADRVAAEFFQRAARKRRRARASPRHSGCGDDANIGTLVGGLHRLARFEIHRAER